MKPFARKELLCHNKPVFDRLFVLIKAYPSEAPGVPSKNRVGCKFLHESNALVYYDKVGAIDWQTLSPLSIFI